MTRKAQTPRSRALARAMFLAALVLPLGARLAAAQEPVAAPDSVAAHAPAMAAPSAPEPPPATPDTIAAAPPSAASDVNPRSATIRKVRLKHQAQNVVRTGPGNQYAIAGVYPQGSVFEVIAKSDDWYNVRLSATETGWVHRSLCQEFDDLSDLQFRPNPRLFTRTGTYVLTGYAGAYAFDRKSNSLTLGGRLGYYVLDRLHAEVGVGWTHVVRPAEIVESLFDLTLEAEKFHMAFYDLGLTFEVLPGRQMVPFVTGGAGSSIMQGRSELAYNYGAGTMLYLSKKQAMRWEVRSYRFHSGPEDARQSNTNIAFTLGTSLLF
jgi:outer membrane beta-barrel protein